MFWKFYQRSLSMFQYALNSKLWMLTRKWKSNRGISRKINGKVRHFDLTVFPIKLNPASFLFRKIVRLLVDDWNKNLLKVACFSDDDTSLIESSFEVIPSSHFVQETLQKPLLLQMVKNQFKRWRKIRRSVE